MRLIAPEKQTNNMTRIYLSENGSVTRRPKGKHRYRRVVRVRMGLML